MSIVSFPFLSLVSPRARSYLFDFISCLLVGWLVGLVWFDIYWIRFSIDIDIDIDIDLFQTGRPIG